MDSYIIISRAIRDSWIWKGDISEVYSKGQAWIDLLLTASTNDSNPYSKIKEKGYVETTKSGLSYRWNWSRSKVSNFINHLKLFGLISTHEDKRKLTIKIIDFEKYQ